MSVYRLYMHTRGERNSVGHVQDFIFKNWWEGRQITNKSLVQDWPLATTWEAISNMVDTVWDPSAACQPLCEFISSGWPSGWQSENKSLDSPVVFEICPNNLIWRLKDYCDRAETTLVSQGFYYWPRSGTCPKVASFANKKEKGVSLYPKSCKGPFGTVTCL